MPAVSKAQEHLFAMAKAVRKGALSKKEAGKKATELADSDISTKDLTDFARTKTKHLPKHVQKEEKMIHLTKEQYNKLIENTKRKAINEAYDEAVDKEEVQNIVNNFNPVVDKIEDEEQGWFSVRIADGSGNSDMKFWMNIGIDDKYNDVNTEWNQYIFNLTNSIDLLRRAIQNDNNMFDKCSSEAVYALEKAGKIYQADDASWHLGNGETNNPVKEEGVNHGIEVGGGAPKQEPDKKELEAVRKAYADMKAQGLTPAFIVYKMPDKFEACANYATAAEYKKQGYKIARCQSGSVTESKKRSLKEGLNISCHGEEYKPLRSYNFGDTETKNKEFPLSLFFQREHENDIYGTSQLPWNEVGYYGEAPFRINVEFFDYTAYLGSENLDESFDTIEDAVKYMEHLSTNLHELGEYFMDEEYQYCDNVSLSIISSDNYEVANTRTIHL